MLKREDIDHLAGLARLALSDEEKDAFPKQLDAVLDYVSEVTRVSTKDEADRAGSLKNVLRDDVDAYSGGEWTKEVLANAPKQENGYIKVEQIM